MVVEELGLGVKVMVLFGLGGEDDDQFCTSSEFDSQGCWFLQYFQHSRRKVSKRFMFELGKGHTVALHVK